MTYLYSLGIVAVIDEHEVFCIDGEPVLNGAFGVPKPKAPCVPHGDLLLWVLRLIMNLIPSNLSQFMVLGDLNELPTSGQWATLLLLAHEILLWSGADRKCFLYIWFIPREWRRLMAFSKRVPGHCVGRPDEAMVRVCSAVIAMG